MTKKQRNAIARRKLNLERLDSRQLLTGIIFDSVAGEVRIEGSSVADTVTARIDPKTAAYDDDVLVVEMTAGTQQLTRSIPLYRLVGPEIGRVVNKISFQGFAGDDTFRNNTSIGSFASGGSGTDRLYGGSSVDTLFGGGGTDYLYGGAHNDTLDGGVLGVKNYSENTGDDRLYGGSGDDTLHASDYGNCKLYGEGNNDTLYGWQGHDQLSGGSGNDVLQGYTGSDRLDGGAENDRYVFSNATTTGEVDTVVEYAGGGTDRLDFSGLASTNPVTVNLASDTALVSHASRRVNTGASGQSANLEIVVGGRGSDTITGNSAWNTLYGGDGADTLKGGPGTDTIYGQAGDDNLQGDQAIDYLYGGTEHDTLHGGSENDYLYGENGNDNLYGGTGVDTLSGGADDDGLFGGIGSIDQLWGGTGSDRFLQRQVRTSTSTSTEDALRDLNSAADAVVHFANGFDRTIDGQSYGAKTWSDDDVVRIDSVFALLHHAAPDAMLVERGDGQSLVFHRQSGSGRGWNYGDYIVLSDSQFSSDEWMRGYVLHEIGHSWADHFGGTGGERMQRFNDLSGWTNVDPHSSAYSQNNPEDGWWYLTDAAFASGYAKEYPWEDLAESFSAYFSDLAGWNYYNGPGAEAIPDKIALLQEWHATL